MKRAVLCVVLVMACVSSACGGFDLQSLTLNGTEGLDGATQELFKAVMDKNITPRMIENLIKFGADINAKNDYGKTALMLAVEEGNIEVVKALIKAGADVNANRKVNPQVMNELIKSASKAYELSETTSDVKRAKVYKALHDKYNNILSDWVKNKTVLMLTAQKGNLEVVKVLIEAGADIFAKDNDGKTVLDYAKNDEVKRIILDSAK